MDYLREVFNQNKKIIALLEGKKKRWVRASAITELTGWDKVSLRRARGNGSIEFKKDKTGIWYNIESLSNIYIKTNSNANASS